MSDYPPVSGRDVVKVLRSYGYQPVGRTGSHVRLREQQDDGTVRLVSVPMHDELAVGTLQNIADQCGAQDFDAFREWIETNR
ncbi:type II toxin-antitoxin system HicA family toxin [Halobacteriales archaeon QS_9_67_17]|nr:MAG: type II toxin-antitoxin system HicA family toxin [Halobacteriales archaeon QS_9_67_17]